MALSTADQAKLDMLRRIAATNLNQPGVTTTTPTGKQITTADEYYAPGANISSDPYQYLKQQESIQTGQPKVPDEGTPSVAKPPNPIKDPGPTTQVPPVMPTAGPATAATAAPVLATPPPGPGWATMGPGAVNPKLGSNLQRPSMAALAVGKQIY